MLQWEHMTTKYRELIHFARQENDFSDEDIEEFHSLCGDFMGKWVTLTGTRNVTNYVHMIGARHLVCVASCNNLHCHLLAAAVQTAYNNFEHPTMYSIDHIVTIRNKKPSSTLGKRTKGVDDCIITTK